MLILKPSVKSVAASYSTTFSKNPASYELNLVEGERYGSESGNDCVTFCCVTGLQLRTSTRIFGRASYKLRRQLSLAPFVARFEGAGVPGLILGMDGA